jgi:transposase
MEYFAGIDVSLRSCALCIVDGKGTMLLERELPCEIKDVTECLASFRHPIERVGFEAGTMRQYLFHGLKAEGFDVVCMEARQAKAELSAMRNKTDKNDARGIAQVLRTGWFSPVHMKSREAHGVRALLKKTMDLANEVRGLLKIFGIRLPMTVKHGSFDGVVRPMIEMDDVLAHALVPLLDARVVLYQHFLELDRRVKRAASQDEVHADDDGSPSRTCKHVLPGSGCWSDCIPDFQSRCGRSDALQTISHCWRAFWADAATIPVWRT